MEKDYHKKAVNKKNGRKEMSDDDKHSDQFLLLKNSAFLNTEKNQKNSIEIKNQTKKINRKINEQKSSQIFFFFF